MLCMLESGGKGVCGLANLVSGCGDTGMGANCDGAGTCDIWSGPVGMTAWVPDEGNANVFSVPEICVGMGGVVILPSLEAAAADDGPDMTGECGVDGSTTDDGPLVAGDATWPDVPLDGTTPGEPVRE